MSKEITDYLGKLRGNLLALEAMEQRISPPPPAPPATVEQAAQGWPAPAKPKKEDYDYVKKLCEEVQAICKDIAAQVDKENKVPPLPGDEAGKEAGAGHKK